jgi:hypothetical protein
MSPWNGMSSAYTEGSLQTWTEQAAEFVTINQSINQFKNVLLQNL